MGKLELVKHSVKEREPPKTVRWITNRRTRGAPETQLPV